MHHYAHWEAGLPTIDFEHEVGRLSELNFAKTPCVIFAKSAGSVLALKATEAGVLKPVGVTMFGPAFDMLDDVALLKTWSVPTRIIQNDNDPIVPETHTRKFLSDVGNEYFKLEIVPGDTHDYTAFDTYQLS